MNEIIRKKAELRKQMKQKKEQLTEKEIFFYSREIIKNLMEQKEYQECQTILTYANFNQEVITIGLIRQALAEKKTVALPRIEGTKNDRRMEFYQITALEDLESGYDSILEPKEEIIEPIRETKEALMILPGLAFDKDGARLGYGGGFYDRYLKHHGVRAAIGLCYDFQLLPAGEIPTEETDHRATKILTPTRILSSND